MKKKNHGRTLFSYWAILEIFGMSGACVVLVWCVSKMASRPRDRVALPSHRTPSHSPEQGLAPGIVHDTDQLFLLFIFLLLLAILPELHCKSCF